jgi:hypothetical protein
MLILGCNRMGIPTYGLFGLLENPLNPTSIHAKYLPRIWPKRAFPAQAPAPQEKAQPPVRQVRKAIRQPFMGDS